jgi:16S rRNA C1402 N4-methylase RsmH
VPSISLLYRHRYFFFGTPEVDGILTEFGRFIQFDVPERGFSIRTEGISMRMGEDYRD